MGINVKEVELRCDVDSSDSLTVDADMGYIVFCATEAGKDYAEHVITINVKKHEARLFAEYILALAH